MQNLIVAFTGRKGTGKSKMMERILRGRSRILFWDAMAEHDWIPETFDNFDDFADFVEWSKKRDKFAARLVYEGEPIEASEFVFEQAYARGNVVAGAEEVPLIASPSHIEPGFGKLVRMGRKRAVDIFWTAQRFAEVPRTLTALTDVFYCFHQSEPRDIETLGERIGGDNADIVADLPRFQALAYDVNENQAYLVGKEIKANANQEKEEDGFLRELESGETGSGNER